jgi:hypothetical protein
MRDSDREVILDTIFNDSNFDFRVVLLSNSSASPILKGTSSGEITINTATGGQVSIDDFDFDMTEDGTYYGVNLADYGIVGSGEDNFFVRLSDTSSAFEDGDIIAIEDISITVQG